MSDAFATHQDVESRWRPLSSAEVTVATQLLQDASDMVRDRWPDTDDRIAADTLSASAVSRVVASMVKRAMNVPVEGMTQFNQTAGPFSQGGQLANPNGNLYFNQADVAVFEGYAQKVRIGWLA